MATGHIRKRVGKNGAVSYQLIVESERDPLTGKRERSYKTVTGTKKQAEATLRKLIAEVENGDIVTASAVKLGDWLHEWLKLYLPNIESTTRVGYREKIDGYIIPKLGDIKLKSLNTPTIQAWVNELKDKEKLAPKTIRNAFLNLKAALDKAVILKMIPKNPCIGVELPKLKRYKAEIYSGNEISDLINAAECTDMYLPVLLEIAIGFRRGELLALKWSDIDFNARTVHVRENRVNGDGKVEIKAPKSAAGIRDITIGSNIVDELKKAHKQYLENKMKLGAGFTDSDLVICQKNGRPFAPDSMTQKWLRFTEKHGLKHIRFHDLRHTCATAMLEAGIDPKTVQSRLGHANISITMDVYGHCTKAMDKKAADKIDEIISERIAN
ncbi:MAG: site-specific integrase [Ruminococcaceae bacterium]|nr:site-specific integrase [Oscillospiraceae bacterium]